MIGGAGCAGRDTLGVNSYNFRRVIGRLIVGALIVSCVVGAVRTGLHAGWGHLFGFGPRQSLDQHPKLTVTDQTKGRFVVAVPSPLLSQFMKRSVSIRTIVLVPLNRTPTERFSVAFHLPAFGETIDEKSSEVERTVRDIESRSASHRLVHVIVDTDAEVFDPLRKARAVGYHGFVDSECFGPWGRALTEEIVPVVEGQFPVTPNPSNRFLTGHSSGAWSALWLQLHYPAHFGGAWVTAPDPLDFKNFYGADLSSRTQTSLFVDEQGQDRLFARHDRRTVREVMTREDQQPDAMSEYRAGEWRFGTCSSTVEEGRNPGLLYDRESGVISPAVGAVWERFNLRALVEHNWGELEGVLRNRVHIFCGTDDTYFLDQPTALFCDVLAKRGVRKACEFIPGRTHYDLNAPSATAPEGLPYRILTEMSASRSVSP